MISGKVDENINTYNKCFLKWALRHIEKNVNNGP